MDKRAWILGLGAVLLIGVGFYLYWTGSSGHGAASDPHGRAVVLRPGGGSGGSGNGTSGASGEPGGAARGASQAFYGDGGVPQVAVRTEPRTGVSETQNRFPSRGQTQNQNDSAHTAGWQLGQARRRVELLEERVQTYSDAVARFEAEGRDDVAERQRGILERVQGRLERLRETEATLAETAREDGTLGDAERGYEEGEQPIRSVSALGASTPDQR